LLDHLRVIRAKGTACIYISHKLDEVFAVADRITVLRDGRSIVTMPLASATIPLVIRHMVGREIAELYPKRERAQHALPVRSGEREGAVPPPPFLSVRNLDVARSPTGPAFLQDISFDLHAGEVLGIGGLMGAGRTELLMHLFGAWGSRLAGDVVFRGQPYPSPAPRDSIQRGLVLASEDRRRYGLIVEQEIGFNLSLSSLRRLLVAPCRIDRIAEHARNEHFIHALRIKTPSQSTRAGSLSGGNQQKVVLGKALMTEPTVVMLDEPTRGIDVGAKLEVYELINQLTTEGKAVLLVSSELPELMGMSDRIIMLAEGRVGGEFNRGNFNADKLLTAAMGRDAAAA
jgi:D-xylose transport system ATP-binding protein